MPKILKSNYENAIASNPKAREDRANRTKYGPPSRITLKELKALSNKHSIGIVPKTKTSNNAKLAVAPISQRKIQNAKNMERALKAIQDKRKLKGGKSPIKGNGPTVYPKVVRKSVSITKPTKSMLTKRAAKSKKVPKRVSLKKLMEELFGDSNNNSNNRQLTITKSKCPLAKLKAQRKNYFNKLEVNKIAANKKAYTKAVAKLKANRNADNPNILLPGESWANHMNRLNKIKAASKRK